MTKEEAVLAVEDYLKFLSDHRIVRVPDYSSKIMQFLYNFLSKFGKGDWFSDKFQPGPGRYKKIRPTDPQSFYIPDLSRIQENDVAWGFTWNSREYYATLNSRKAIVGTGIIIFDKTMPKIYHSPSFDSSIFMMEDYLNFRQGRPYKVRWNFREIVKHEGKWEYAINILDR